MGGKEQRNLAKKLKSINACSWQHLAERIPRESVNFLPPPCRHEGRKEGGTIGFAYFPLSINFTTKLRKEPRNEINWWSERILMSSGKGCESKKMQHELFFGLLAIGFPCPCTLPVHEHQT
jgi:hypothetical protein